MATEVLRPQDVLSERFTIPHASFHRRRNFPANLNINRRSGNNVTHRKTSPKPEKKKINVGEEKKGIKGRKDDGATPAPVILLRRGELLDSLTTKIKSGNPKVKSPKQKPVDKPPVLDDIGSESEKPIYFSPPPRHDGAKPIYAGSAAFALAPSPESLPFPSFFNKKQQNGSRSVDDSATRDLRRLLRLD